MTIENLIIGRGGGMSSIKANAPSGATFYADIQGVIIYLFRSSYGYRQIQGNLISFYDSGIPRSMIKPL